MAMREKHKVLARLFWRRLSILALLLLVVAAGFAVHGVYLKEKESRILRQQAEFQLEDLRTQEKSLTAHIDSLRTDRGREGALREQYSVGRAGEELIVIVEPTQQDAQPATTSARQWVKKFLPFW